MDNNHDGHVLAAARVSSGYGARKIIEDIDIIVPEHEISVIIGANGCGKSTLLKTFARLLMPAGGAITLDGRQIQSIPSKILAQELGLLPQSPVVPEGIRVTDLVSRGRFPYRKPLKSMSKADFEAVEEALEMMGITELADRCVDELSGGQRQRVWIALALAQQTDILLLDEPTTFLDISYQVDILDLLADLNRTRKTTIVMVLHDINLSSRYADYIYAMREGRLIAEGSPSEIITPELIKEVYGLDCLIIKDPLSGMPFIIPKGKRYTDESTCFSSPRVHDES